jgi:diguanylate cyclase (GGDEF)-like protein/PAS domain S-box-containing protein
MGFPSITYDFIPTFDSMPIPVYFVDKNRKIIYWNRAAEEISGYKAAEVLGSRCFDNILIHIDKGGLSLCRHLCPLAETIKDGAPRTAEVFFHHKAGHRIPVRVHTSPLMDKNGAIVGGVEIFTDMREYNLMRDRVAELEDMALFDELTGLPNRAHIRAEIDVRFHEMARYGISFAVLFIDIDNFKGFNDRFGHGMGDQVLKTVAATLSAVSRPFDLFGRWGGEEFVGVLKNIAVDELSSVAERYRNLIKSSSIHYQTEMIGITVSIGGTVATSTDTVESVIDRADRFMYESKKGGRDRSVTDTRPQSEQF